MKNKAFSKFSGIAYTNSLKEVEPKLPDKLWRDENGMYDSEKFNKIMNAYEKTPYVVLSNKDVEMNKDKILNIHDDHSNIICGEASQRIKINGNGTYDIHIDGILDENGDSKIKNGKKELSLAYSVSYKNGVRQPAVYREVSVCEQGKRDGCKLDEASYTVLNSNSNIELNYNKNKNDIDDLILTFKVNLSISLEKEMSENTTIPEKKEDSKVDDKKVDDKKVDDKKVDDKKVDDKKVDDKKVDDMNVENDENKKRIRDVYLNLKSDDEKIDFVYNMFKVSEEGFNNKINNYKKHIGVDTLDKEDEFALLHSQYAGRFNKIVDKILENKEKSYTSKFSEFENKYKKEKEEWENEKKSYLSPLKKQKTLPDYIDNQELLQQNSKTSKSDNHTWVKLNSIMAGRNGKNNIPEPQRKTKGFGWEA